LHSATQENVHKSIGLSSLSRSSKTERWQIWHPHRAAKGLAVRDCVQGENDQAHFRAIHSQGRPW